MKLHIISIILPRIKTGFFILFIVKQTFDKWVIFVEETIKALTYKNYANIWKEGS